MITLRGHMGHSGAETAPVELAATKLRWLLKALDDFTHKAAADSGSFPLGPRASVKGLRTGAKTYSVTAAKIECAVDIRLTPQFRPEAARVFITKTLAAIGRQAGNPSTLSTPNSWPAYKTSDDALLQQLLQKAAAEVLGAAPPLATSGPSNIGNYLGMYGTQVLSGFGVDFKNIHGPDECVRLASIGDVFAVYRAAVREYLA